MPILKIQTEYDTFVYNLIKFYILVYDLRYF